MNYPKSVAHYTSVEVLCRLLNGALNGADGVIILHLSHIAMINDYGEGEFFLSKFFTDSIKKTKLKEKWDTDYYPNHTPFVLSTSATDKNSRKHGSLPMWKMYGDDFKGALIKFNSKNLSRFCMEHNLMFSNCNYSSTSELSRIVASANSRDAPFSEIMETSCFIKQLCWKYENEWRVVVFGNKDTIKNKCTSRGIIKYMELNIPLELIEEVCIGPLCPIDSILINLERIKEGLAQKHPGKVNFKIKKSNIPLKNNIL